MRSKGRRRRWGAVAVAVALVAPPSRCGAAEQAIEASGVPYTFFRPTYFIDNLPRHRQGGAVVLLGEALWIDRASLRAHPRVLTVPLPAMRAVDRLFPAGTAERATGHHGVAGPSGRAR